MDFAIKDVDQCNRRRLTTTYPIIITNNCLGGYLYHWLGLEFVSPFINIGIPSKSFIELLENFDEMMFGTLEYNTALSDSLGCPVGILGGIVELRFRHADSFSSAKTEWARRLDRMNHLALHNINDSRLSYKKDMIAVMLTHWGDANEETYIRFDRLPFSNKIAFTNKKNISTQSNFYIERGYSGIGLWNQDFHTGKRMIDQFDYVSFLNRLK